MGIAQGSFRVRKRPWKRTSGLARFSHQRLAAMEQSTADRDRGRSIAPACLTNGKAGRCTQTAAASHGRRPFAPIAATGMRKTGPGLQQGASRRRQARDPLHGGVGPPHASRQRRTRGACVRRRSAALQHLPLVHNRVGQDVGSAAQLLAKPTDVNVYGSCARIVTVPPNRLQ